MQFKRRRLGALTPALTSERSAIAQYHRGQCDLRWENYKTRIADADATPAQRSHLSNKTVKMRDGLQKAESTLATHIRTERIGLNAYLHSRNVPGADNPRCACGGRRQTAKHILMHCPDWTHLRPKMLREAGLTDYRIIVSTAKGLRAAARMMMETELLEQFRVARALIFNVRSSRTNLVYSFSVIVSAACSSRIVSERFYTPEGFVHPIHT